MGTHGRHGQVRTQVEKTNAQHQQNRTNRECDQLHFGKIEQRSQCHHIHNQSDRQSGYKGLQNFIFQLSQAISPSCEQILCYFNIDLTKLQEQNEMIP